MRSYENRYRETLVFLKYAHRRERGLVADLAEARDNVRRKDERYRIARRHVADGDKRNRKLLAALDAERERNKALTAQIDHMQAAMVPIVPSKPAPCTYKVRVCHECRRCLFDPKDCGGCGAGGLT